VADRAWGWPEHAGDDEPTRRRSFLTARPGLKAAADGNLGGGTKAASRAMRSLGERRMLAVRSDHACLKRRASARRFDKRLASSTLVDMLNATRMRPSAIFVRRSFESAGRAKYRTIRSRRLRSRLVD